MKKVCIGWDEEAYNSVLSHLEPFLSIFNNRVDRLRDMGCNLTIEDIKGILDNKKEYLNNKYVEEYKEACDFYGFQYEEVKEMAWRWTHVDLAKAINQKAHTSRYILLKDMINEIYHIVGSGFYFERERKLLSSILEMEEGKVKPIKDYKNVLKEKLSYYTQNDKQIKEYENLCKIKKLLEEIGMDAWKVRNYFFNDGSIDAKAILED